LYSIIFIRVLDNSTSTVIETDITEYKRLLLLEIGKTIFIKEKIQILLTFNILFITSQTIEENAQ